MNRVLKNILSRFKKDKNDFSAGTRENVICLVTTILNYDELYFKYDLSGVGKIMNTYYSVCADHIIASNGDLNSFCGKHTISLYGVYHTSDHIVDTVVDTAVSILESLQPLSSSTCNTAITCGIGICSGKIIYGSFGSTERATFTGFGEPVNCAFKLAGIKDAVNICDVIAKGGDRELLHHKHINVVSGHDIRAFGDAVFDNKL